MAPLPRNIFSCMDTVTDKVCRQIRARVLDGRYAGGAVLVEEWLAADLDASGASVRDAIVRLGREGWVDVIPYRGARVVDWTTADMDEVSELRALLESQAVRRAARHITAFRLERLAQVVAEAEHLLETGDATNDRLAALNLEFHQLIIAAAGSRRLQQLLATVMDGAVSSRSTYQLPLDTLAETTHHHRDLLEAIAAGDAETAAELMRVHIERVYSLLPA